jgi:hypothetical protein
MCKFFKFLTNSRRLLRENLWKFLEFFFQDFRNIFEFLKKYQEFWKFSGVFFLNIKSFFVVSKSNINRRVGGIWLQECMQHATQLNEILEFFLENNFQDSRSIFGIKKKISGVLGISGVSIYLRSLKKKSGVFRISRSFF